MRTKLPQSDKISTNSGDSLPDLRGFQQVTLIDWQGRISSIIFLGGCNFRCGFCHSSSLVFTSQKSESVSFSYITDFLKQKKGWIDGVVITGGEPTLDEAKLVNLIRAIRDMGFPVKLDTNGTMPDVVDNIINKKYIEYIAMDIKSPMRQGPYSKAVGVEVNIENIIRSKDIVMNSGIDYEFRTTAVPGVIGKLEIEEISKSIAGAKRYFIQQFVPRDTLDPAFLNLKPYSLGELDELAVAASAHVKNVMVRK